MAEYIEREALLSDIQAAVDNGGMGGMVAGALKRYVKRVPAADVAPTVHGRWIHNTIDYPQSGWIEHKCSICEHWQVTNQPTCEHLMYCPNCGAKMDAEGGDKA